MPTLDSLIMVTAFCVAFVWAILRALGVGI